MLLLLLNIFAPTTTDVRVVNYVVPVVSQVRGRVVEVPVENNRPVKKDDVLFRIDPTPYANEVHSLEARLASDQAKVGADRARLSEMQARLSNAESGERQLNEQLNEATGQVTSILGLARPGEEAGRPEHRARGRGRRQPIRTRAGADQRQRAVGEARRRACGRTAGQGEAVGQGRRRTSRRSRRPRRRLRRRRRR